LQEIFGIPILFVFTAYVARVEFGILASLKGLWISMTGPPDKSVGYFLSPLCGF
jgi:hypothetical protein